jgi:hypothetical protein
MLVSGAVLSFSAVLISPHVARSHRPPPLISRAPIVLASIRGDALTHQLDGASSLAELVQLHSAHGDNFQSVHTGACWGRVKKLARAERKWLHDGGAKKLRPFCEQTAQMLPAMEPSHVAKTARALGKTRLAGTMPWELVWNALPAATLAKLDVMNPKQLTSTAWAFATVARDIPGEARHAAPDLFEAVAQEATGRLADFNAQDIANLAWAFATASYEAPLVFDALALEVARRPLADFKPQEMVNTVWAFATVGHAAPELLEAIAAEAAARQLKGFNAQALSNMAWAFAVLDYAPRATLFENESLFADRCTALATEFEGPFRAGLLQLHQYSLWREERGATWPPLHASLQKRCLDAFLESQLTARPSRMQLEVSDALKPLCASVSTEYVCEVSGYSIDAMAAPGFGESVAVEVDGPAHFVGDSRRPTGATVLKRRQLRFFGWPVANVAHWEWSQLEWSASREAKARKRSAYLRRKIEEASR